MNTNYINTVKELIALGVSPDEAAKNALAVCGIATEAPVAKEVKISTGKKATTYSLAVKDYEPKKDDTGYYVWASYKAQRSHYCYAVATGGACNKNPYGSEWAKAGNVVDYSPEGAYYKAKAEYEATFKYIAKANRR